MSERTEVFGPEGRGERVVRWAVTLLLCAHFTLSYMAERWLIPLQEYAAGQAPTPYQYRMLPTLLMRAGAHLGGLARLAAHMPLPDRSVNELVMVVTVFVAMLTAVLCMRATLQVLTRDASVARWMCLLVVLMSYFNLAPTWGLRYSLPYDLPSLAFFAVGLWLLVSGRMPWFYPLFVLATLNRETTCFLVVFYLVWAGMRGERRGRLVAHAGALTGIWVAIKLWLGHVFRANVAASEGGLFLNHMAQNLRQLCEPQQWPVLLSVCGFTLPLLWLGRRWIRNRPYEMALGVVLALWFAGMMIVGVLVEIRVFSEWAVLVTPALGMMAANRFGTGSEPAA